MARFKNKLAALILCCSILGLIGIGAIESARSATGTGWWIPAISLLFTAGITVSSFWLLKTERERIEAIKRELATSNLRLREIIDNAPQPITIRDLDGNMIMANQGALQAYRLTPQEVVGIHESHVANQAIVDGIAELAVDSIRQGKALEKLFEYSVEGVKVAWSVVRFPVRDIDGKVVGTGGIATDVTELFEAERRADLASKEADQARRAAESARHQADLSRQTAERANAAKSEFLSRMSHELRTPMNAILGFAQLMELQSPTEDQRESIGHILKGGKHLLSLINEVLELSRIETGNFSTSIEPIGLPDVVAEVADLAAPAASRALVRIERDLQNSGCLFVKADRQRLRQVLLNLLTNAVKYNEPGGRATVRTIRNGDRIRFEVLDTGIGIPPEKVKLLFTPFERLGAETRSIEGTGLGLALSQRLVEAMHGEIGYLPNPAGKGSLFWFELPRAELPMPAPLSDADQDAMRLQSGETNAKALLYIEDNVSNVTLMEQVVKGFTNHSLTVAMTGRDGLNLLAERRFDLVLLDLHLPDLQGSDVLLRIKGSDLLRGIPVIVVSADATQRQIDGLLELGAVAYLTKPFQIPRLLEAIRSAAEG